MALVLFGPPASACSLIHYAVSKMGPRFHFPPWHPGPVWVITLPILFLFGPLGMPILDVLHHYGALGLCWVTRKGQEKSGCIRLKRPQHEISSPRDQWRISCATFTGMRCFDSPTEAANTAGALRGGGSSLDQMVFDAQACGEHLLPSQSRSLDPYSLWRLTVLLRDKVSFPTRSSTRTISDFALPLNAAAIPSSGAWGVKCLGRTSECHIFATQ